MDDHSPIWVSLGLVVLIVIIFCITDCGMGEKQYVPATIVNKHYEPSRTWVEIICHTDTKTSVNTCYPETRYEPEHYWIFITSSLGNGRFDNRVLFNSGENKCTAKFSRGKWTGRVWGPLNCK